MPATTSVKKYIENLPDDRKKAVTRIREVINKNIPRGFKESVGSNMIVWSVAHSDYPPGYHCDPTKPLMLMCLSSTKGHIALHHMGLYASGSLMDWFKAEWPNHSSKKLDIGKACVRFKDPDEIPLELVGQLAAKMTPDQWVEQYEQALSLRTRKE